MCKRGKDLSLACCGIQTYLGVSDEPNITGSLPCSKELFWCGPSLATSGKKAEDLRYKQQHSHRGPSKEGKD